MPKVQGLIRGSTQRGKQLDALVDRDDVHCLMIGASGVGKTAFFLYPNLEFACASGMSYLALDTKGDLARNYGTIAQKYHGYHVSVIDLRNPTRSDGSNLLTLINRYMDIAREQTDEKIRAALDRDLKGSTNLIISHRITTLLDCDNILVLDHGKVLQLGTPQELLVQEGLFRKIYDMQMSVGEEETA